MAARLDLWQRSRRASPKMAEQRTRSSLRSKSTNCCFAQNRPTAVSFSCQFITAQGQQTQRKATLHVVSDCLNQTATVETARQGRAATALGGSLAVSRRQQHGMWWPRKTIGAPA
jgi:hypothetical protein